MLKKVISLTFIASITCFAMEENNLQPWVQAASKIEVSTTMKKLKWDIPIQDDTTIAGVKEQLDGREGIPPNQQLLYALSQTKIWMGLRTKTECSPALRNNERVKAIMSRYNTDTFKLILTLRNNDSVE